MLVECGEQAKAVEKMQGMRSVLFELGVDSKAPETLGGLRRVEGTYTV